MRRHLPLLGLPPSAVSSSDSSSIHEQSRERVRLGPGSIGIADTGDGLAAAELAVALSKALREHGLATAIVLLGFEGVPALPASLERALSAMSTVVSAYAVGPEESQLPHERERTEAPLRLWVGVPAVTRYQPALGVLLGADRAITGWPAPLRSVRGSFQLELSQNRLGFAAALAGALNQCGFLPRR